MKQPGRQWIWLLVTGAAALTALPSHAREEVDDGFPYPWLSGSLHVTTGTSPESVAGAQVALGLRWTDFGVAVEGRADAPGTVHVGSTEVTGAVKLGSVVPCLWRKRVGACAVVSAGALRVSGQSVDNSPTFEPLVLTGLRGRIAFPIAAHVAVGAMAEGALALVRPEASAAGLRVWRMSQFAGSAGIGFEFYFF